MANVGVVGVTIGINQLSNFEPGCEAGLCGDGLKAGPEIGIRDGAHGSELVTGEGEIVTISGGMAGVCGDIPCEDVIADGDGPTGIGVKASDLGEGGGLIGAQRVELSEEEEPGWITDVGVVSGRVLSGAVLVDQLSCKAGCVRPDVGQVAVVFRRSYNAVSIQIRAET